jgi:hypothetical protein
MDISVSEVAGGWVVQLGRCRVPFDSREAAGLFVERLRARLAAPHFLPAETAPHPVMSALSYRA